MGDTADKRKFSASQTSEEEQEATKRDARERVMTIGGYSDPFCMMDPKRLQVALEEKEEAIACIKEKIRQIVKSKENVQEKEKDCLDEMRLVEEMIHFCMMDPKRLQLALEEKEEAIASIKEKIGHIVKSKENVQEKEKDCLDEMRLVEEMIHFCMMDPK